MFKPVPDDAVRHVWVCPLCPEAGTVPPTFYANAGTPMCGECMEDMDYIRTEIDLEALQTPERAPREAEKAKRA